MITKNSQEKIIQNIVKKKKKKSEKSKLQIKL